MYNNNNIKAKRKEMKLYYYNCLTLYEKWYVIWKEKLIKVVLCKFSSKHFKNRGMANKPMKEIILLIPIFNLKQNRKE